MENNSKLFQVDLSKLNKPAFLNLTGKKYIIHKGESEDSARWTIVDKVGSLEVASHQGNIRLYPIRGHTPEQHVEDAVKYRNSSPFSVEMLSAAIGKFVPVTADKMTLLALHHGAKYNSLRLTKVDDKTIYLVPDFGHKPEVQWENVAKDALLYAKQHPEETVTLIFKNRSFIVEKDDNLDVLAGKRDSSDIAVVDKTLSRYRPPNGGLNRF